MKKPVTYLTSEPEKTKETVVKPTESQKEESKVDEKSEAKVLPKKADVCKYSRN